MGLVARRASSSTPARCRPRRSSTAQDDLLVRLILRSVVRHLRDLDGRRDQPRAVRPARGRGRAGRRLPHRVLLAEVRAVLPRRVHQHGHRLRARHHAVPRRLARAVGSTAIWDGRQRGLLAVALVLRQGAGLHLLLHLAARHAAAAALRPVHGVRLEAADPGLAGLDRRRRARSARSALDGGVDRQLPARSASASSLVAVPRRCSSSASREPSEEAAARRRRPAEFDAVRRGLPGAADARPAPAASRARPPADRRRRRPTRPRDRRRARMPDASRNSSGTRSRGSGSPSGRCSRRSSPSSTRSRRSRPRRASTAGTSSTAGPTAWRSASAASCAPGPARPTRSTSRAPSNTDGRAVLARASATAASTRSTTCAASSAGCASRPARPGR